MALALAALAVAGMVAPVMAQPAPVTADVFVATNGNDAWSGAVPDPADGDGPVATVQRAIEIIRQKKADEEFSRRPLKVLIRGGEYFLNAPISFGARDAGYSDATITYAAYPGERPVLSAGRAVSGWVATPRGWKAHLPDVEKGTWNFEQLYVDDQRRFRPFLPKEGYYKIEREIIPSSAVQGQGFDRFGFAAGDLHARWNNSPDIEILILHERSVSRLRPGVIDSFNRVVQLTGKTRENWYSLEVGARYRVENVKEAFGEPGDWYLDRPTGELTYLPKPGESAETASVVAPRLEHVMILASGASNLKFEGLTFANSSWITPARGSTLSSGAVGMPAAILAVGVRNVAFDGIAVRNVGGYGIWLGPGCMFDRIVDSEFADLGAGGIEVGGGPSPTDDASMPMIEGDRATANITIENNSIFAGGRVDPAGEGIRLADTRDDIVRDNDIHDIYSTGIQVGGTLGLQESDTSANTVFRNLVYDIGQGVLSDLGGISTIGPMPGTVISENVVHDVKSYAGGGWGLYAGDGSSHIVFEHNLVYRTSQDSFFLRYGRDLTLRHNIFTISGLARWRAGDPVGALGLDPADYRKSMTFDHNIVVNAGAKPLFAGPWAKSEIVADRNLYWDPNGSAPTFSDGTTWTDWRNLLGRDNRSQFADPRFAAPEDGDFTLGAGSPAVTLGFRPFNPALAGPTGRQNRLLSDLLQVPSAY